LPAAEIAVIAVLTVVAVAPLSPALVSCGIARTISCPTDCRAATKAGIAAGPEHPSKSIATGTIEVAVSRRRRVMIVFIVVFLYECPG
jgi:hypothetical protein